ncbi:hypothetical protein [Pseudoxanthomonas sp. X-1]|uniref:hypothetical protein n=1 Tax=Pseudoxanthomonas sp. X-1 TaxID=2571115 RepID=UPI001CC72E64|nr:hypothetical protein [Pseudoxanthomonas sp. X-1]UAY74939.1 hypothetical protein LAJ50_01270 [Pseudoxanthomonas sp. X-1]
MARLGEVRCGRACGPQRNRGSWTFLLAGRFGSASLGAVDGQAQDVRHLPASERVR